MRRIGIGLYGENGHQVGALLKSLPAARLVATAALSPATRTALGADWPEVRHVDTLDALLRDGEVECVSLCSPRRADQPRDAVQCLAAGRHVYAEKPCALSEPDLDAILAAASRAGCRFHEMAGTAFEQPYRAMRQLVGAGRLGTVVQVLAQKSYPMYPGRPQDEAIDGGLIAQNAIHAVRMIEHVGGVRVASVEALETALGNPVAGGGLRMAAALLMRLENGGVGTAIANYLNPAGFGRWGNETLRVFGTAGMVEATDGGTRTRLVIGDRDLGPLEVSEPSLDFFALMLEEIRGRGSLPIPLEEELHPTRVVIRARASAHGRSGGV